MNNYPMENRNWLELTKNVKSLSDEEKTKHLVNILKVRRQKQNENKTLFLRSVYRLRILCIIKAYFPEGYTEYEKELGDVRVDGSKIMMNAEERRILSGYQNALMHIEKYKDTTKFDTVDRIFGNYRHKKWVETQNS